MAAKAGIDPVEFRLGNMTNPRMRRVLEAAARQFAWKSGKSAPSGRGFGVACGIYSNGYAANMAESGRGQGHRGGAGETAVVTAIDVGLQLQPRGSAAGRARAASPWASASA